MTKTTRGPVTRAAPIFDNILVGSGTAPFPGVALANRPTPILTISIQCPSTSPETLYVGNIDGQHRELPAGAVQVINVNDLQTVHVMSLGGTATYNYIAGV